MGKCIKINIGEIPPKAKRGEKPKRNKRIIIKIRTKEEKAQVPASSRSRGTRGARTRSPDPSGRPTCPGGPSGPTLTRHFLAGV